MKDILFDDGKQLPIKGLYFFIGLLAFDSNKLHGKPFLLVRDIGPKVTA
jgi:hypothetical protein